MLALGSIQQVRKVDWYSGRMLIQRLLAIMDKVLNFTFFRNFVELQELSALEKQNASFDNFGWSRSDALKKLNEGLQEIERLSYSEDVGMFSEHLLILSAISIKENGVSRILEIGTFDGRTAQLLSYLFPKSEILTIDLPFETMDKSLDYEYAFKNKTFIASRDLRLKSRRNITFREFNSIGLTFTDEKFDLIWIDGDHSFPVVAVDISNALRLLEEKGLMLCDDVYLNSKGTTYEQSSVATHLVLESFSAAGLIEYRLIPKRIGLKYWLARKQRKYVAIVCRPQKFDAGNHA